MDTNTLRKNFLSYFEQKKHTIVPSSSVLPHDDPTLLFINAGMNQFKDVFLGKSKREYTRAVSSQKCIRAGGKHNDLENVGHTQRHLTFFEMLGNFSFGDYFKEEAIACAWEVSTQIFQLDPERIYPTVFTTDDEAFELWKKYVPEKRIYRFGESENFWAMGETGPCGPCSELLYDKGANYGNGDNPHTDTSGERFLEFWNLVFMQFNRFEGGEQKPLPKPSIDTGAGLERIMSLLMGVDSVFETDVLRSLIAQVEQVTGKKYNPLDEGKAPAFRVIADHLRSLAFAIADGGIPSNVDRGYVLRKILRRATRYGRMLGMENPFLAKVLPCLVKEMGHAYPELMQSEEHIAEILTLEEESFLRTLKRGGNILGQIVEDAKKEERNISGEEAFKLKDTYGLPIDEILLLAKDCHLEVDMERFKALELEAKEKSRQSHKATSQIADENLFATFAQSHSPTIFEGFLHEASRGKILALVKEGNFVDTLNQGEEGMVVLDKTSFYAEMGGQVGDSGVLTSDNFQFRVQDCQAPYKGITAHIGRVEKGTLQVGNEAVTKVEISKRRDIEKNHTATHLLHWALHKVLGSHIRQAGSVVDPERLRFDFSHHKKLTEEEIEAIEDLVNTKILTNAPVATYTKSYQEVQKSDEIKQFFGEKYGAEVRVVDIDAFSKELCGGTHVASLGEIGLFKIAKESSIAAGTRRIEAVTGRGALALMNEHEKLLRKAHAAIDAKPGKLLEKLKKILEENKEQQLTLKRMIAKEQAAKAKELLESVENVGGIPFLSAEISLGGKELKDFADKTMDSLKEGVLCLANDTQDGKCQILIKVSDSFVSKGVKASELIKEISPEIDGGGGGKPNNAQAGGTKPEGLKKAIEKLRTLLEHAASKA